MGAFPALSAPAAASAAAAPPASGKIAIFCDESDGQDENAENMPPRPQPRPLAAVPSFGPRQALQAVEIPVASREEE